jgi:hypothetical protein
MVVNQRTLRGTCLKVYNMLLLQAHRGMHAHRQCGERGQRRKIEDL